MRLAPWMLVACVTACGGGKPAKSGPQGLTAGESCIKDADRPVAPPEDAPEQIDVMHILVKHAEVKGAEDEGITRSREEACLRATEARAVLMSQGDWDAAYKEYSDKQANKGVIKGLKQGGYEKAFSDVAFSTGVNEVSYVVETKRGFHVILRTP